MRSRTALALLVFIFSGAAAAAPKPQFVVEAEQNYAEAQRALEAAQKRVTQFRNIEVRKRRAAMARYGQWIEPDNLWRAQRAAKQNAAFARLQARQAFAELSYARDAARRMRVGTVPKPEPLTTPFWELW